MPSSSPSATPPPTTARWSPCSPRAWPTAGWTCSGGRWRECWARWGPRRPLSCGSSTRSVTPVPSPASSTGSTARATSWRSAWPRATCWPGTARSRSASWRVTTTRPAPSGRPSSASPAHSGRLTCARSSRAAASHAVTDTCSRCPRPAVRASGCTCSCAGWSVARRRIWGYGPTLSPARLLIPVDTHIENMGRALGLTRRRSRNWKMAEEITARLALVDPADPVKYDFALCHKRMSGDCRDRRDAVVCAPCGLRVVCRHWRGRRPARD